MDVSDWVEEHCILRLPENLASAMRDRIRSGRFDGISVKCRDKRGASMEFYFDGKKYDAQLRELPCVMETYKTFDKESLHKCQNVSQMLIVYPEGVTPPPLTKKRAPEMGSGLTPPTKNIKEERWDKTEHHRLYERQRIAEVENEIQYYMNKKPQDGVIKLVPQTERMKLWTDDKNGHVENNEMAGDEYLEERYAMNKPYGGRTNVFDMRGSREGSQSGSALHSPLSRSNLASRSGSPKPNVTDTEELFLTDPQNLENQILEGDDFFASGFDFQSEAIDDDDDSLAMLKKNLKKKRAEKNEMIVFNDENIPDDMKKQTLQDIETVQREIDDLILRIKEKTGGDKDAILDIDTDNVDDGIGDLDFLAI